MRAHPCTWLVVAGLLAASCAYVEDDLYETTTDTSTDTGVLDTAPDPAPDPAPVPDADPDTGAAPDTGAPPEDPGTEEETPDPGPGPDECTPTAGGDCNVVEQCGCPPGSYCKWGQSTSCTIVEECHGALPGTGTHGSTCSSPDGCAAGHSCLGSSPDSGICYKWCRDSTDCPTASTCDVSVDFSLSPPCTDTAPGPLSACSL